jgi:acetylornithine deacetylase/succinyl-diaminopimelate desuccinylase-like protein
MDVSGRQPALMPHMAATGPMHPVCGRFGIPAVGFGTGYWGSGPHAPDEHIRMSDYWEGVDLMAAFVAHFGETGSGLGRPNVSDQLRTTHPGRTPPPGL